MIIVVSDSSSLVLLEKINLLETLIKDKLNFLIANEVKRESVDIGKERNYSDAFKIEEEIKRGLIKVKEVKDKDLVVKTIKDFNLGKGEAESIILYSQERADLLATDDKLAINACKALNIINSGTISFVIKSFDKNLISKKEALEMLEKLAKYGRYKSDIIFDTIKYVEGEKNEN